LDMMRGEKKEDRFFNGYKVIKDWSWTHPTYSFDIGVADKDISQISIDLSGRLADVDRTNNVYPLVAKLDGGNLD